MSDAQASTQRAQPAQLVLTVEQAAAHLGCSVNIVRRRIKDGPLAAEKVPGKYRPEWRVMLNAVSTASIAQASTTPEHYSGDAQASTQLAILLDEVLFLRTEVMAMRQEIAELGRRPKRLALEAPKGNSSTAESFTALLAEPAEKPSHDAIVSDPPRRPGWAFWR